MTFRFFLLLSLFTTVPCFAFDQVLEGKEMDIFAARAQLDASGAPDKEEPYIQNFSLGANYAQGNTDSTLLYMKLDGGALHDKDNLTEFFIEHSFGEENNETNVDYSRSEFRYEHLFTKRSYLGASNQFFRDEQAELKYRVTNSLLLGRYFLRSKTDEFKVEIGPAHIVEELNGPRDDFFTPFLRERYEHIFENGAKIYQLVQVAFQVDDTDNLLLTAEAGLEAPISNGLALALTVTDQFDNEPAEGADRNDLRVVSSIKVNFGDLL